MTSKRQVSVGTFVVTEHMREMIADVLDSGRISYGKYSKEFENEFARLHTRTYAILSNSGTSALQVALQAMRILYDWQDGDEVIVPATTFVATANIVKHNHMQPIFVDVEEDYYCINPNKILNVLTERTRAILPVNMFGQSADMHAILDIADAYSLRVIEDSCEAMFAEYDGEPVGSYGDIACYSTYVAHLLTTGVGGLSLTDDPELAAIMRSLVNHGLAIENLNPTDNFQPRPMTGRRFEFTHVGHSFRITEFEAALGLAQLETYEEMLDVRRRNAKHLIAGLEGVNKHHGSPLVLPKTREDNYRNHAWMMFPIVLEMNGGFVDKTPLVQYLNEAGIETRDMPSMIAQPAYPEIDREQFPISNWIARSGFYVGCHQELTPEDMQYVIDTIGAWHDRNSIS